MSDQKQNTPVPKGSRPGDGLQKLKAYFDNELDFYKYYRSGSSYLDHKYFLRGKFDIKLALDSYYFETDTSFSTSHDFKVAQILANDLIQLYLENQLIMIENKDNIAIIFFTEINIFDFAADIYDRIMSVSFIHRIREERKFNNALELASQLKDDRRLVEEQFLKED
mgnify:CR=1 FL=1